MATLRICSVEGCRKPVSCKGLCENHYYRLRKHGDPTAGRVSRGEPMRFIEEVALRHTGTECLIWPYGRSGHGYGQIDVDGRTRPVHLIVCEAVNGPKPDDMDVAAHSCGNGHLGCISPGHLRWSTFADNSADIVVHDRHVRGSRHTNAKLVEADVLEILALRGTASETAIAERFNVGRGTIARIYQGKNWAWLTTSSPVR